MNDKPCVKCGSTDRYKPPANRWIGRCISCYKTRAAKQRRAQGAIQQESWPHNDKPCVKCGGTERYEPRKGKALGACVVCREKYLDENNEKFKQYRGKYRAENSEILRERRIKYYAENCEEIRNRRAKYADKYNAKRRVAYAANPRQRKEANAKWKQENPDKRAAQDANRRARLAGAEGTHTADDWLAILDHYDHRCLRCGAVENITKDHIVPINKGGSNWPSNLQPLCGSCNSGKCDYHSTDYRPTPMVSA